MKKILLSLMAVLVIGVGLFFGYRTYMNKINIEYCFYVENDRLIETISSKYEVDTEDWFKDSQEAIKSCVKCISRKDVNTVTIYRIDYYDDDSVKIVVTVNKEDLYQILIKDVNCYIDYFDGE